MKSFKQAGTARRGLLVIMMGILFVAAANAEMPKIATVDMQKLFKEHHQTVDALNRFNDEYSRIQKSLNEREEAMNKLRAMIKVVTKEIKKAGLSAEELKAKKAESEFMSLELRMMENEVRVFSATEKERVAELKAASMQGIMKDIKQRVAAYAEEEAFDFVFDKSGKNTNQVSFFIHLRDAEDITAHMLKEIEKSAPNAGEN